MIKVVTIIMAAERRERKLESEMEKIYRLNNNTASTKLSTKCENNPQSYVINMQWPQELFSSTISFSF
jgi:hypothetical protein